MKEGSLKHVIADGTQYLWINRASSLKVCKSKLKRMPTNTKYKVKSSYSYNLKNYLHSYKKYFLIKYCNFQWEFIYLEIVFYYNCDIFCEKLWSQLQLWLTKQYHCQFVLKPDLFYILLTIRACKLYFCRGILFSLPV